MVTSSTPLAASAVPPESEVTLLPIAAVERETGLGKDTLRAWERRYGFPLPLRDGAGVRGYPRPLVERLRLIRRALLNGHRPGRLLGLPAIELDAVLASYADQPDDSASHTLLGAGRMPARLAGAGSAGALALTDCLVALRIGGGEALRHWLTRGLARLGLAAFVTEGIAPLTADIGAAWACGRVAVYEEHLYCEVVQSVLRNALLPFQGGLASSAPAVLLTTVPGEEHGLGLLMAEVMMTLEGCRCLALGVQTPIADIVAACRAHRIQIVALSYSENMATPHVLVTLTELRARLPSAVTIWAGGGAPALRGLALSGIEVLARLVDIVDAVARWRKDSAPTAD